MPVSGVSRSSGWQSASSQAEIFATDGARSTQRDQRRPVHFRAKAATVPGKTPIQLYQNNCGSHENYLTRRSAAVVHPRDAAQIVAFAEVFPGCAGARGRGRAGRPGMTAGRRCASGGASWTWQGSWRWRAGLPAACCTGGPCRPGSDEDQPGRRRLSSSPSWPGPSMIARGAPRPAHERESGRGRPAVDEALPEHV